MADDGQEKLTKSGESKGKETGWRWVDSKKVETRMDKVVEDR
jgi:hypothetical protein